MSKKLYKLNWVITGNELKRIKLIKTHKLGQSGSFMHVGSIPFYVKVYPKGVTNEKRFEIGLHFNTTQHNIRKMKLDISCIIPEISYIERTCAVGHTKVMLSDPPRWNRLKHLKCITVRLAFNIIDVVTRDGKSIRDTQWNGYFSVLKYIKRFNGSLGKNEMNKLKNYKFLQNKSSSCFYIGKIPFRLEIYPKGSPGCENFFDVKLNCAAQKLDISKMYIWWRICLHELGYTFIGTHEFTDFPAAKGIPNLIKSDELLNLDALKIDVMCQILSLTNKGGNNINQKNWNQYICNNDEQKQNDRNGILLTQKLAKEVNVLKRKLSNVENKLYNLENKYNVLVKSVKKNDAIALFLQSINMEEYYDIFITEGFETMNSLKNITKDILTSIGITKVGHYTTILNAIKNYDFKGINQKRKINGENNIFIDEPPRKKTRQNKHSQLSIYT